MYCIDSNTPYLDKVPVDPARRTSSGHDCAITTARLQPHDYNRTTTTRNEPGIACAGHWVLRSNVRVSPLSSISCSCCGGRI
jgi:hypothetical protein